MNLGVRRFPIAFNIPQGWESALRVSMTMAEPSWQSIATVGDDFIYLSPGAFFRDGNVLFNIP